MRLLLVLLTLNLISLFSDVHASNEPLMDILSNYDKVTNLTSLCSEHLTILRDEIESDENWALKVRDVSGKKAFGFTIGNNFWIGSEDACENLNDPARIFLRHSDRRKMWDNATEARAIIPVQYRMFYIAHASTLQFDMDLFNQSVIHIGLCLPKVCIEKDAKELGEKILVQITCNNSAVIGKKLSFEGTKLLKLRENFINDIFVKFLIYVIFFFGTLVTIGSFYVKIKKNNSKAPAEKSSFCNFHFEKRKTVIDKFWSCFALQKNFSFIMSSNLGTESLETIHGIRTIGIFYIIVGHVYYYALPSIDNLQKAFTHAESWILQPFFAAAISVDSFYTISGILLAYGFYEKQRRRPSKNLTMDVIRGAVYRYIRIAPCFMIVMLFAVTMSIFFNDTSQFRVFENLEQNCKLYWWRNLLFIQNFYPLSEMCMSWSWYVSTDFQLFFICSVILAISAKNMKFAVFSSILIASIASIYTGYIGVNESFGFSLDNQYRSIDKLYTKPYVRAAQYITGLWTGYYLSKTNRNFGVGKLYVNLGWILSIATVVSLIYVQIYKQINVFVSFMFPAFGRVLWALPICFFVIAGTSQYKNGFFAKILNSKFLLPFSRMSFSAYLFNPLVVMFLTLGAENPYHLDFYTIVIYIIGFYFVTYFVALIFMLFFENPIIMFTRKFISS